MGDPSIMDWSHLVGVPFEYDGRGPDTFDCYGLVRQCWRETHGIELPDFKSPSDPGLQAALGINQLFSLWQNTDCQPGVMAAIRIGSYTRHCAFVIDNDTMIHAWEPSGGVSIVPLNEEWKRRITGFYRYAG